MNRQQRRREKIKEPKRLYSDSEFKAAVKKEANRVVVEETEAVVKKLLKQRKKNLIDNTYVGCGAVSLTVLHKEFKFGKKRLQAYYKAYNEEFDKILKNDLKLDDVEKIAQKMDIDLI